MKTGYWIVLSILLLLTILVTYPTLASGTMEINWYVIGGGGGTGSSGDFSLNGTIGQPITGRSSLDGTDLCAGFWCRVLREFRVFFPMIFRN